MDKGKLYFGIGWEKVEKEKTFQMKRNLQDWCGWELGLRIPEVTCRPGESLRVPQGIRI